MKRSKFLTIVLVLLIVAAVGAKAEKSKTTEDLITVTVFRGDPGDQPTDDNRIYKKIEDELGIRFEFEFLAGDLNETLSLKLADEQYPDLFDGGNSAEMLEDADVLIDFSSAKAIDALLDFVQERKIPVVLCSTGLSEAQLENVEKAAQTIPVLRSANMSLGINLLMKLVQEAARVLAAADFDIEIVEQHHRRKLDAPSGTAKTLAAIVDGNMGGQAQVQSIRAGEIPRKRISPQKRK